MITRKLASLAEIDNVKSIRSTWSAPVSQQHRVLLRPPFHQRKPQADRQVVHEVYVSVYGDALTVTYSLFDSELEVHEEFFTIFNSDQA